MYTLFLWVSVLNMRNGPQRRCSYGTTVTDCVDKGGASSSARSLTGHALHFPQAHI